MNILNQIYYSAKRILVDIRSVFIKLLSFIVIILILGSAFSSSFDADTLEIVDVVLCSEDSGTNGEKVLELLDSVDAIKSLVQFQSADTRDEGMNLVDENEADALVYIPEDFSAKAEAGEQKVIEVYWKKDAGVNATVVKNVMNSFTNALNTGHVILKMTGTLDDYTYEGESSIESEPLTEKTASTSMCYYAVSMLLMLILYGAEYGATGVAEDYLGTLGDRLKLSPMRSYEQYVGKVFGLSCVTFIQAIIVILFTKFVFDVNWGSNFLLLLGIVFIYSVLTTTLGAMLCIVTKDVERANSLINVAVIVFTFLAGGFVVANFGAIEKISPSYYAKTAIFNIVYGGSMDSTMACIRVMCILIVAFATISVFAARRKRA